MPELSQLIRDRHSERTEFDPSRTIPAADLDAILEAARWAPTPHNMQNFEIVVIDDPETLAKLGRVPVSTSADFIRENYAQLSFSEDELSERGTGLLASMFPPPWRDPRVALGATGEFEHGALEASMRGCPLALIVLHDRSRRAPASEGDMLGLISLGCVMQNMWLTAESLGLGMQIMSTFSGAAVQAELRKILEIPDHLEIAFACRLGHPAVLPHHYPRVRRPRERFVHRNGYAARSSRSARSSTVVRTFPASVSSSSGRSPQSR
jgi:nitroreductase